MCLQMFTYMKKISYTLPNLYGILGLNNYILYIYTQISESIVIVHVEVFVKI